jgi:hypothetical protein
MSWCATQQGPSHQHLGQQARCTAYAAECVWPGPAAPRLALLATGRCADMHARPGTSAAGASGCQAMCLLQQWLPSAPADGAWWLLGQGQAGRNPPLQVRAALAVCQPVHVNSPLLCTWWLHARAVVPPLCCLLYAGSLDCMWLCVGCSHVLHDLTPWCCLCRLAGWMRGITVASPWHHRDCPLL